MTVNAGPNDYGEIFELIPGADGTWTNHIVHAFTGGPDSAASYGNLVLDSAGNVYAETLYSVVEFSPAAGGKWSEKTLHNFTGGSDGAQGESGLAFSNGNLYGTTAYGGYHMGIVFELHPDPNGTWSERVLHRFTGGSDGFVPGVATLAFDATGNVYGTTPQGGSGQFGTVFEIKHSTFNNAAAAR
jgi:uncharacterized repeat protein (TIGR03803 family)